MAPQTTRPSLLSQVRDLDDQAAWRAFDERYRTLVDHYCRRRGLAPADAEDVCQQVMVTLTRTLRDFRYRPELGRFRDYLGGIVRNVAARHFSRQESRHEVQLEDVIIPSEAVEDETWNREWVLHHYRRAMTRVEESFRPESVAIFNGLLEGRNVEELAERHGTSPAAVYKVKQRIRDRLQELIERQLREEEFEEREPLDTPDV